MTAAPDSRAPSAGSHAALLAELAAALAGAASLDELCDRAVDAVRASLGTDRASVLLFDQDGVMRFRAWKGLSDAYRAATDGHSPWEPDTADAEPIVVPNVANDPALEGLRDVILREHIQALAFVPIAYAGRLLGKYMLYFDEPRQLSADELVLAGAVADQIAVAVEQHRVAHELRASREQLEVIFRGGGGRRDRAAARRHARVRQRRRCPRPRLLLPGGAARGARFEHSRAVRDPHRDGRIVPPGGAPRPARPAGRERGGGGRSLPAPRHGRGELRPRQGDFGPRRRRPCPVRGQPLPGRDQVPAP